MKQLIDYLLKNESTKKSLIVALELKNDCLYSADDLKEHDQSIDRKSAQKCLKTLEKLGMAEYYSSDYSSKCYYLDSNHKNKEEVIRYLETRGIKIKPKNSLS